MFFEQPDTMGYTFGNGAVTNGEVMDWLQTGVTPGYNGNEGNNNGGWWDNWGDNIFGLISQGIGAWGRNPTQQIGSGGVLGVGGGYTPAAIAQQQAAQQQALALQNQQVRNGQTGGGVGSTVGGGVDGIFKWATDNPVPVFIGLAGVYLLFMKPPGRR